MNDSAPYTPPKIQEAILARRQKATANEYAKNFPLWKTGLVGDGFQIASAHPYTAQHAIAHNIGGWAFLKILRKYLIFVKTKPAIHLKWIVGISIVVIVACACFRIIEITQETGFSP